MVLDSAFSNLYNLMMELVDVYKIRLPKFTVISLSLSLYTIFLCSKCSIKREKRDSIWSHPKSHASLYESLGHDICQRSLKLFVVDLVKWVDIKNY